MSEEIAKNPEKVETNEDEPTDEQIGEAEQGLFDAIAKRVNPNGVLVSRERLVLLEKMESYAQAMAEDACDFFQNKDIEARKRLILKAVEIVKTNPSPASKWAEFHQTHSGSLRSQSE